MGVNLRRRHILMPQQILPRKKPRALALYAAPNRVARLYAAHAVLTQNFVEDACSFGASIAFSEIGDHPHFSSNALFPVHPAPPNKPRSILNAKACDMTLQKISPLDAPLAADANLLRNQCRARRQFQIEEHKRRT